MFKKRYTGNVQQKKSKKASCRTVFVLTCKLVGGKQAFKKTVPHRLKIDFSGNFFYPANHLSLSIVFSVTAKRLFCFWYAEEKRTQTSGKRRYLIAFPSWEVVFLRVEAAFWERGCRFFICEKSCVPSWGVKSVMDFPENGPVFRGIILAATLHCKPALPGMQNPPERAVLSGSRFSFRL